MASKKITLAIFSSAGRQRLQVESNCRASALKTKIRDILHIEEDFRAVRDNGKGRPGDKDIKLAGMTTILSMGLKNGDVIHVFPLAGTRFQETEDMLQKKSDFCFTEISFIFGRGRSTCNGQNCVCYICYGFYSN